MLDRRVMCSKIFEKLFLVSENMIETGDQLWEYIQNSWESIRAFTIIFTTSRIFERIRQPLFDEWKSAFSQKAEISNICYNWRNS